jgi:hypothetical protein
LAALVYRVLTLVDPAGVGRIERLLLSLTLFLIALELLLQALNYPWITGLGAIAQRALVRNTVPVHVLCTIPLLFLLSAAFFLFLLAPVLFFDLAALFL